MMYDIVNEDCVSFTVFYDFLGLVGRTKKGLRSVRIPPWYVELFVPTYIQANDYMTHFIDSLHSNQTNHSSDFNTSLFKRYQLLYLKFTDL